MANLKDRPYVGTWQLGSRELVQHTPDALVYLNGEMTLPGCSSCSGRIDFQKYITEVSVDAGVDSAAASASFTLSIPVHSSESFARDAKFLLHPGLEVHVYERGYFPVRGLYSNLGEPLSSGEVQEGLPGTEGVAAVEGREGVPGFTEVTTAPGTAKESWSNDLDSIDYDKVPTSLTNKWRRKGFRRQSGDNAKRSTIAMGVAEVMEHYWRQKEGYSDAQVRVRSHYRAGTSNHGTGAAIDYRVTYNGGRKTVPMLQTWGAAMRLGEAGRIPKGGNGLYLNVSADGLKGAEASEAGRASKPSFPPGGSADGHYDFRGAYGFTGGASSRSWVRLDTVGEGHDDIKKTAEAYTVLKGKELDAVIDYHRGGWRQDDYLVEVGGSIPNLEQVLGQELYGQSTAEHAPIAPVEGSPAIPGEPGTETSLEIQAGASLLERFNLAGLGVEDVLAYPYYHVFHGVVIQVGHSYSGGIQTVTIQCASMLHFWQYHKISSNAAIFGARPKNSALQTSMEGNIFTSWHPYQIMYFLHDLMVGQTDAVGDSLASATNVDAVNSVTGRDQYSMMIEYWNRRFNQRQIRLRMHGVNGSLFSAAQAAFLGQTDSEELSKIIKSRMGDSLAARRGGEKKVDAIAAIHLGDPEKMTLIQRQSDDNGLVPSLSVADLQAFVWTAANMGQTNLWESPYESKLDIARRVTEITQFEFYQDVDGDFVFKPPMYNLDTSTSRVYRIEDIDIISISFDEKEPQATYTVVKSSHISPSVDVGLSAEVGRRAVYVDYRLVAQYGFRPFQFETAYAANQRSMMFIGMARLDVLNAPVNSASVTIPHRPELRPGYPVYVVYLDCYYYLTNFSHSFSVGGQCTSTLNLVGKRAKFYAPGSREQGGIEAVDLSDGTLPQRPLEVLGGDGQPRFSGFPNVVMALDPTNINPMFSMGGVELSTDNPEQDLRKLLRLASREGIGVIQQQGDGVYTFPVVTGKTKEGGILTKDVVFYFQEGAEAAAAWRKKAGDQAKIVSVPAEQAALSYSKLDTKRRTPTGAEQTTTTKILSLWDDVKDLQRQRTKVAQGVRRGTPEKARTEKEKVKRQRAELQKQIEAKKADIRSYEASLVDQRRDLSNAISEETAQGIEVITQLLGQVGRRFWIGQDAQSSGDIKTATYLNLLWDRKSSFTTASQPGNYRYYSASHPDPDQQGQKRITYLPKGEIRLEDAYLGEKWAKLQVQGFIKTPARPFAQAKGPEAELGEVNPVRGIRVYTNNQAGGEILPTSEIRTLMFSVQDVEGPRKATDTTKAGQPVLGPAPEVFEKRFSVAGVGKPIAGVPLKPDYFVDAWAETWVDVSTAVQRATLRAEEYDANRPLAPGGSDLFGSFFDPGVTLDAIQAALRPEFVVALGGGGRTARGATLSDTQKFDGIGQGFAQVFWEKCPAGVTAWHEELVRMTNDEPEMVPGEGSEERPGPTHTAGQVAVILRAFFGYLSSKWGFILPVTERARKTLEARHSTQTSSPVFPVSDARGYEVIGSYQYGRDVDIEPGGVWDAIRSQDPLSVLDQKTLADFIRVSTRGEPVTVDEQHQVGGKTVTVSREVRADVARTIHEKKILEGLRRNYTDKQLLDLGLLQATKGDPDKLTFNLMNYLSTAKEGVHKLPVVNAGLSLADLAFRQDGKVCNCRAMEADVQLEAFGQEEFLQFSAGGLEGPAGFGTGDEDQANQVLTNMALQASLQWKVVQDNMRGTIMDQGGAQRLIQTAQSAKQALLDTNAGDSVRRQQAEDAFDLAVERAGAAPEDQ